MPVVVGIVINTGLGALIAYMRIPSIVATLGMLSILKGGLISLTGGTWISGMPPEFFIAQARLFGIPAPVYFMVILTVIVAFWMRYSATGRSIYAVGGNAEAARASGLSPERTCVLVFALHGLFAGIAALLFATQLQVIQSTVPPNLELTVITAAVIGGVSILGGTGTVIGSTLAAILFACIGSALIFLNVSAYWLRAVLGLLILATVLADMARRQRRSRSMSAYLRSLLLRHETILGLLLIATLMILSLQSDRFFTADNLLNQGRLMAEVGLVALAMTFVIVTGGIDLSVGSILGLVAILLGVFWQNLGIPLPLAMILGILVGGVAGLFNGLIITRFGVPPLIATLATLALYRGLAEGISQARSVRGYPDWFFMLGQGEFLGVPVQLWIFAILAGAAAVVLGLSTFGRSTYAIGSNAIASRFSGLRVDRTLLFIYTASGMVAGLAAVIFVSRVSTTRSDMGTGLELDVITAVVLGGTSIFGGRGTIIGTLLGLVLMQALKNGLALAGVKGDGTIVVIGAVLIGTILLSNIFRKDADG